jgi:hypothetical protein
MQGEGYTKAGFGVLFCAFESCFGSSLTLLLCSSSSSLEAIDTYIDAPGLPLSHLLEAFSTSELPLALQALSDHASKTGQQRLDALVRQIRHDRDHAIRQQTVQAEPLIPVLSVSDFLRMFAVVFNLHHRVLG